MNKLKLRDRDGGSEDPARAPEEHTDRPDDETGSSGSHEVATPFSPHSKDKSPWGDSDQHSDA